MIRIVFIFLFLFCATVEANRIDVVGGGGGSGSVSDTIYGAGWDGDTTVAPSKNAVYDKIETIASGGDNVSVNSTGATNANFLDNLYHDWAIDTVATPDDITSKFNYAETLAGNPALLVDECVLMKDASGGGFICEGSTADTNEQLYRFPDVNGADTTTYFALTTQTDGTIALTTDTTGNYVGTVADGTGIDGTAAGEGATYTPVFDATELEALTWGAGGNASNIWTFNLSGTDPTITFNSGAVAIGGALSATGAVTGSNLSGTNTGDNTIATSGDSATSFFSSGTLEVAIGGTGTTTSTGTGAVVLGTSPTITTGINLPAGAIDAATEIAADLITHTQIVDADQMDTKCLWFEDPVAGDDFTSIWFNGTGNDFQVTEIWAESDQTVTFMLQLDDGTPADCDTVDLAPAAGTAEDTALDGDCLIAAGERLDLATTSVASTPTWVSICFTGNWAD